MPISHVLVRLVKRKMGKRNRRSPSSEEYDARLERRLKRLKRRIKNRKERKSRQPKHRRETSESSDSEHILKTVSSAIQSEVTLRWQDILDQGLPNKSGDENYYSRTSV